MGFRRGQFESASLGETAKGIRRNVGALNSVHSGLASFSKGISLYANAHRALYASIGNLGDAIYNRGAEEEDKHKEVKIKEDKLKDIGVREGSDSENYINEAKNLEQSQNERDLSGRMMSAMFGYNYKTKRWFE